MKYYIFISSSTGNGTTAIKIFAHDEPTALTAAYSCYGGDDRLQAEDFNVFASHSSMQRICRLFQVFTGQTILYFAEEEKESLIDDLYTIDTSKCEEE